MSDRTLEEQAADQLRRNNEAAAELEQINEQSDRLFNAQQEQNAANRRNYVETRNKFMVLAAGIAGVLVPVLATTSNALPLHQVIVL